MRIFESIINALANPHSPVLVDASNPHDCADINLAVVDKHEATLFRHVECFGLVQNNPQLRSIKSERSDFTWKKLYDSGRCL